MKSGFRIKKRSAAVPVLSGAVAILLAAIVIISFAYYRQMRLNQFTKNILFSDNYFLRNYTYNDEDAAVRHKVFTKSEAELIVTGLGIPVSDSLSLAENADKWDVKAFLLNCAAHRIADLAGVPRFQFREPALLDLQSESYTQQELRSFVHTEIGSTASHLFEVLIDPSAENGEPEAEEEVYADNHEAREIEDGFVFDRGGGVAYEYGGYRDGRLVFNLSGLISEGLESLPEAKELYGREDVYAVYYFCAAQILFDVGDFYDLSLPTSARLDGIIDEYADGVRLLDIEHVPQLPEYPNGCEAVCAVMLLRSEGFDVSKEEFVESYLPAEKVKISWGVRFGPDPEKAYAGDPSSKRGGWGCFAPVIENALDLYLEGKGFEAENISGISLDALCRDYISRGVCSAVWVTTDFAPVDEVYQWLSTDREEVYLYPKNQHCAVLIGYDKDHYYFCDPLKSEGYIAVGKAEATECFASMGSQAVIILEKE